MWETFTRKVEAQGNTVQMSSRVVTLHHVNGRVTAVDYTRDGAITQVPVEAVVSTMPLRQLIDALSPEAPHL